MIRYHTKRIGEEFPLEEQGLENLILRKVSFLYKGKQKVGQVLQIAWNAKYPPMSAELQAELYFQAIPSDVFLEKGLVHREHAFKPLELDKPLEGIVISNTNIFFSGVQNHFLIRPEHIDEILHIIAYQKKQQKTFAAYNSSGSSMIGFQGYYYEAPGISQKERRFIPKENIGSIRKETRKESDKGVSIVCEYWNDEKVSETRPFGDNSFVTVKRNALHLFRTSGKDVVRKQESIYLSYLQILALKKFIGIYRRNGRRRANIAPL